jgi:HD-GYP domain-containing protein (c-di-GMP phosphodiesterase class II)
MTANRPYRSAQSAEYALEELRTNVGIQFDATAVAAVEAYLARGSHGETRPAGLSIAFA